MERSPFRNLSINHNVRFLTNEVSVVIRKQCVLLLSCSTLMEKNPVSEMKSSFILIKGCISFLAQEIFRQQIHFNGVTSSLQRK